MKDPEEGRLEDEPAASREDDAAVTTSQAEESANLPERGIDSINRSGSLQARLSNWLAMGLMSTLGLSLLTWYYVQTYTHRTQVRAAARTESIARAQAEMPLPSLGAIDPPAATPGAVPAIERLLGPAPAAPDVPAAIVDGSHGAPKSVGGRARGRASDHALERRLAGPVFTEGSSAPSGAGSAAMTPMMLELPNSGARTPASSVEGVEGSVNDGAARSEGTLGGLLRPTVTSTVRASVLPTQELLLPKGAFIDCTLETAIDSSLPGLTTCISATDTFGADGKVVLLERGTKLVGETRGIVQQGSARVFVLWTEARTPSGVIVPLASPGTDELGRAGLPGEVNRHFFERFGAAMLISVIDGAVQATVAAHSNGGAVIYNPTASEDVMTEVLKGTVNIPPTVVKANGDRIQILVARDLDFRSVYELRAVGSH
jgi:type IV secretion system protein VirB10